MKSKLFYFFFPILGTGNFIGNSKGCPNGWSQMANGPCFYVNTKSKNFNDAEQECQLLGAHLASVHTDDEMAFIHQMILEKGDGRDVWLGAKDFQSEGTWMWKDGSVWDFQNWRSDQPNDGSSGNCLAHYPPSKKWMDKKCSHTFYSVCRQTGAIWTHKGCYKDSSDSILPVASYLNNDNNTIEKCKDACSNYLFAGVRYGKRCFCGNEEPSISKIAPNQTECDMKCPGNSNQTCGGSWRTNVYKLSTGLTGGHIGCYEDSWSDRALPISVYQNDSTNTIERCKAACSNRNYLFAGVQYGEKCFCGNEEPSISKRTSIQSECDMECPGNYYQICGGSWRMNVYESPTGCPNGWSEMANGACFYVNTNKRSYDQAIKVCQQFGSSLASIHSDDEMAFIHNMILEQGNGDHVWLGGSDSESEGTWAWSDGSVWGYDKWRSDQPNDGTVANCLAHYSPSNAWMDKKCWHKYYSVCRQTGIRRVTDQKSINFILNFTKDENQAIDVKCCQSGSINANTTCGNGVDCNNICGNNDDEIDLILDNISWEGDSFCSVSSNRLKRSAGSANVPSYMISWCKVIVGRLSWPEWIKKHKVCCYHPWVEANKRDARDNCKKYGVIWKPINNEI